jgi:hypothetical protein
MYAEIGQVPISLELDFSSYEGDWKHVAAFHGQTGWLLAAQATIQSEHDLLRSTLIVACDDRDNAIPSWRALHLTQCSWSGLDYCYEEPPQALDDLLCEEEGAFYARWQRATNAELAAFHEKSQREADALDRSVKARARQLEHQIGVLRQRRRRPDTTIEAQITLNSVIADLEAENDNLIAQYVDERSALRRRAEAEEEVLWHRTDVLIEVEPLYMVRWRSGYPRQERDIVPKWIEGHFHAPPAQQSDAPPEDADAVLAKVEAALRANVAKRTNDEPNPLNNATEAGLASSTDPETSGPLDNFKAAPASVSGNLPDDLSNGTWTPTKLATLRQMWADGMSADEIAMTLGGVKRNAVIGKAYRLGLSKRQSGPVQSSPLTVPAKIAETLPHATIGDELSLKRTQFLDELVILVEQGQKFLSGSPKFKGTPPLKDARRF